jgi:hypothetical protein
MPSITPTSQIDLLTLLWRLLHLLHVGPRVRRHRRRWVRRRSRDLPPPPAGRGDQQRTRRRVVPATLLALRQGPLLEQAVRALPIAPEVLLVNATGPGQAQSRWPSTPPGRPTPRPRSTSCWPRPAVPGPGRPCAGPAPSPEPGGHSAADRLRRAINGWPAPERRPVPGRHRVPAPVRYRGVAPGRRAMRSRSLCLARRRVRRC